MISKLIFFFFSRVRNHVREGKECRHIYPKELDCRAHTTLPATSKHYKRNHYISTWKTDTRAQNIQTRIQIHNLDVKYIRIYLKELDRHRHTTFPATSKHCERNPITKLIRELSTRKQDADNNLDVKPISKARYILPRWTFLI